MHPTERTVPENSKETEEGFLNEQCREIKENNTMGNTRDLFTKIRDMKATFHERMGRIKDRNSNDLTEGTEIKKRWQEYTK